MAATATSSGSSSGGGGGTLTIGTTDKITSLDPAGSYDNGSFAVMNQVYPFLMNTPLGSPDVEPDIAESASFTSPTEYTVKLKPGLKFANGHDLTVLGREVHASTASSRSTTRTARPRCSTTWPAPTRPTTPPSCSHLKSANDQMFAADPRPARAGPIVDEQVFSADGLTPDDDIVKGKAFAGQYTITNYDKNNLVQYKAYPDYKGLLGAPKTATVNVEVLHRRVEPEARHPEGNIDVAFRSLAPTDIDSLRKNNNVKVVDGPGGEIRYIVFNFNTMPFGAKTAEADPAKALAVRQAVADLIDRKAIADQVYKGTYTPLYSFVPDGLTGATQSLKDAVRRRPGWSQRRQGEGGPDRRRRDDAGELNLQYNTDHYGPSSGDEYALIKDQLESSGLFKVNLQSTEYVQYSKDRVADVYPAYQLGWFPDYSDADNYLTPFFLTKNFLQQPLREPDDQRPDPQAGQHPRQGRAHQAHPADPGPRGQGSVHGPLPAGRSGRGRRARRAGRADTLDPSFKFRYGALSKG